MDHPVPPYLIALAVGDLAFKPLGPRTGVYAEPVTLAAVAPELDDTERMVTAAEGLYGKYRWGRYDLLVLPPSFPYGGMENPTLTFLTPTIFTGDKANTDVVAHELAHSWSGNLVTNATWSDSWLNEGFTTYFENRIDEIVYGKERAAVLADLSWDDLQRDLQGRADAERRRGCTASRTSFTASWRTTRARPSCARSSERSGGSAGTPICRPISIGMPSSRRRPPGFLARPAREPDQGRPRAGGTSCSSTAGRISRGCRTMRSTCARRRWPKSIARSPRCATARRSASIRFAAWGTQEWQRFLNGLPRKLSTARLAELDAR